jgi:hypothetical protein
MATIKQTELLAREEPSGGTAMHWIGGQWLDSGEHRESINPATGEVIGSYVNGGRKETELGVSAALRAFRETDWKDNRSLRARVLNAQVKGVSNVSWRLQAAGGRNRRRRASRRNEDCCGRPPESSFPQSSRAVLRLQMPAAAVATPHRAN